MPLMQINTILSHWFNPTLNQTQVYRSRDGRFMHSAL